MIGDSLHYALLSESREAPFSERRLAAAALLEVARSDGVLDDMQQVLATVEQRFGGDVLPEARALVSEFGVH